MTGSDRFNLVNFNPAYLPNGKSRLSLPSVSREYFPLIGIVAVFWGDFELHVNELLASFVTADNAPDDAGWHRRNFKKRKELLRLKVKAHFGAADPITTEIAAILSAGAEIHWQRNLVVHGQYQTKNDKGFKTRVAGIVNKRYVVMPVTLAGLEKMYHDLALLSGRLTDCCDPSAPGHNLSSQDRSRLLAFVRTHPANLPTPQRLANPNPPLRVSVTER